MKCASKRDRLRSGALVGAMLGAGRRSLALGDMSRPRDIGEARRAMGTRRLPGVTQGCCGAATGPVRLSKSTSGTCEAISLIRRNRKWGFSAGEIVAAGILLLD